MLELCRREHELSTELLQAPPYTIKPCAKGHMVCKARGPSCPAEEPLPPISILHHTSVWVSSTKASDKQREPSKPPCTTSHRSPQTVLAAALRAGGIWPTVSTCRAAREHFAFGHLLLTSKVYGLGWQAYLFPLPSVQAQAHYVPKTVGLTCATKYPETVADNMSHMSTPCFRKLTMI